ncbi:MAG: hypothetical protein L6Q57_04770 [Alphaproteobacteria bacterium]|nr:hypothetical protein [Alphaproteobacteria bacterium]
MEELSGLKILFVNDRIGDIQWHIRSMQTEGAEVITAENIEHALTEIKRHSAHAPFHVVICDLWIPMTKNGEESSYPKTSRKAVLNNTNAGLALIATLREGRDGFPVYSPSQLSILVHAQELPTTYREISFRHGVLSASNSNPTPTQMVKILKHCHDYHVQGDICALNSIQPKKPKIQAMPDPVERSLHAQVRGIEGDRRPKFYQQQGPQLSGD